MGQSLDKAASGEEDVFLSQIPPSHRIERRNNLSPADFEANYYNKDIPVIITDVVTSWPAYNKWTTDYLEEQIGRYTHTFRYGKNSIQMKVADYIQRAKQYAAADDKSLKFFPDMPDNTTEKLPYIRHFGPLKEKVPKLYEDINPTTLFSCPDKVYTQSFLFMGVPETKTNIHYDTSSNFVAIISGTKHIALLPPGGEQNMNVSAEQKIELFNSEAVDTPDPPNLLLDSRQTTTEGGANNSILMHEHPVFDKASSLVYSPLRAGEMVFIPKRWYHYIHNVDFSVSVTIQTMHDI
eukprot:Phypoly_transcript_11866.p1 GENE.Phypoly_transcript_11866~~Phypoly_transcript_11866.p1  ORF type:complete len:294 (+),score=37.74 Phypoly_transcript_11866:261-1142(+)